MAGMKISDLDFVRLLPAFMRDDEAAIALSKAMNKLIQPPGNRIPTIRTWDEIDNLNEPECDELAWELDIDWYDSTGMSLEEKRETIKLAQQIKRKRGTKWAVERLISAYFGEGYVMEWYEMYDSPYTFVALTTNTNTDAQNFEKFVEAVKAAKNARSHLAGVFYYWQQGPDPGIEYRLDTSLHRYNFVKCGTRPRIATVGFIVQPSIDTDPEETKGQEMILAEYAMDPTRNDSKIVVFGDASFISDEYVSSEYLTVPTFLFLSTITWMYNSDIDMSIADKEKTYDYMLLNSEAEANSILYVFGAAPLVIAAIGIVVWARRRNS